MYTPVLTFSIFICQLIKVQFEICLFILFAFFSICLEINFKSRSVYLTKRVGLQYALSLICDACMM